MSITSFFSDINTKQLISNLVSTCLIVIVGVGALLVTTTVIGPLPISINQVTTEKFGTFDVFGEAEIVSIPDQAVVDLGFSITNTTVEQAQNQANQVTAAIIDNVKQLGIDAKDIKTINYSIYPEYNFTDRSQEIIGYRVNNTVQVTIRDTDLANQVIDAATQQGANQIGGVQFILSPEKEKELLREAREKAISQAKDNAKELANLAGMRLGKIVNISESRYTDPIYPMHRSMAVESDYGFDLTQPTQLEPGSSTHTYSVYLSYETL